MSALKIGVSASRSLSKSTAKKLDYIEIKKISEEEIFHFKKLIEKPILFHLQYSLDDSYYIPSVSDFKQFFVEISNAYKLARPRLISLHFGLSAPYISIDHESFVAVAESKPLTKDVIVNNIEKNLEGLKATFPDSHILVENLEFIPEAISKGAYRWIQDADFFSSYVLRWKKMGILDGIVLDIAHALIAAGNHPYYNGIKIDPIDTFDHYIDLLRKKNDLLHYFERYISKMPLSLIKEIHISGISRLSNGVWVDSHGEIGKVELKAIETLLDLIIYDKEDIPIILEYSRDTNRIPCQIDTLRNFVQNYQ